MFTLNTKHHPDGELRVGANSFYVNGHQTFYLRNSRHEADRASQLLTSTCGFPVPATGLIVPVGHERLTVKPGRRGVHVVAADELTQWLRALPDNLTHEQIEAVFAAARRPQTWRT